MNNEEPLLALAEKRTLLEQQQITNLIQESYERHNKIIRRFTILFFACVCSATFFSTLGWLTLDPWYFAIASFQYLGAFLIARLRFGKYAAVHREYIALLYERRALLCTRFFIENARYNHLTGPGSSAKLWDMSDERPFVKERDL